jgi:hypothetical protein
MRIRVASLSFRFPLLIAGCSIMALAQSAPGQAPGLLWSTGVGGRLFAVDAQTNAYAAAGTDVIVIDRSGHAFQTNSFCPLPGLIQRDSSGNFYFGGSFDGTQDFGGITLVGGWTNWPAPGHYNPGWPTCFLAKYAANGALQWATSFGQQSASNCLYDIVVDASGNCWAAFCSASDAHLARINASGSLQWDTVVVQRSGGFPNVLTLGALTSSNCTYFAFDPGNRYEAGGRTTLGGSFSYFAPFPLRYRSQETVTNSKPLIDDLAQIYQIGRCSPFPDSSCTSQVMRKCTTDAQELWNRPIEVTAEWQMARDAAGNIYAAGTNGAVFKFDGEATEIWSNNFGNECLVMVVDGSGNRFVSFSDGSVARLADDPAPQAPSILGGPQSQTVFVGDNVTMSVAASGTAPLRYFWRFNGTPITGATNTNLQLNSVTSDQSGSYSVIVSNTSGSITSAPAALRVKTVELYYGSQLLTNGTYTFNSSPTLSVRSAYASGESFYTLDGSAPSFGSTYYSGPFVVSHSGTVRAIGYSADFSQSEEADAVNVSVLANHTLNATSSGGGTVTLNPAGGRYLSTNTVTVTAVPASGWSFLYWLGDAPGNTASINISMERDKAVYAVFGTTLSTTVAGNGQVQLSPPGGLYPYGTVVRVTGVPQPGNYFGFWGNAATGNSNPLYFTVNGATPTISSIFGATSAGQSALTILINGAGRVSQSPAGNVFSTSQTVMLTATPDAGQTFVNWSGDASGTQNPLSLSMSQSRVITANFSDRSRLRADRPGLEGLTPEGFRFTILSDPGLAWQVFGSSNLSTWTPLGTVTNSFGEVQFLDTSAGASGSRFYKAVSTP